MNKLYFYRVSAPASLSFEIESQTPSVTQVFWTQNKDETYNEANSMKYSFQEGKTKVNFDFPKIEFRKIRIDPSANNDTVKISNVVFEQSGKKITFNDFENYKYNGVKDKKTALNSVEITASDSDASFEIRRSFCMGLWHIDWMIFTCIAVFSVMFSCMLGHLLCSKK